MGGGNRGGVESDGGVAMKRNRSMTDIYPPFVSTYRVSMEEMDFKSHVYARDPIEAAHSARVEFLHRYLYMPTVKHVERIES